MRDDEKKFLTLIGFPLIHDDLDGTWVDRRAVEVLSTISKIMVNCFSALHTEEIVKEAVKHPMERSNMLYLFFAWVEFFSQVPDYQVDGRNEESVEICKMLKTHEAYDDARAFYCGAETDWKAAELFCMKASEWHRTLQQTFAGILFAFAKICPALEELNASIDDEYWYRVSMV